VKDLPATVSVAEREDEDVFAATVNATVPLPLPLAPDVIVIHVALLVAAHAQPVPAVTETDPEPPLAATDWLVGLIESLHELPASVTVNVLPPIVRVPVRELDVVLAATVKPMLPEPLPLAPDVTVIHEALLTAVHAQPAGEVSATVALPPFAPKLCEVGEIALLQVPGCVTVIH
jgi:hypothetical protein